MISPIVLIILDGWGYSESRTSNAIALDHTPTWDALWRECPHTTLVSSGLVVGLPAGQMGNSEVGHLTMGAGRVVYQDLTRISGAIANAIYDATGVRMRQIPFTPANFLAAKAAQKV